MNNNTVFSKARFDKGIKYIEQIYDYRIKRFYTFQNLKTLYDIQDKDFLKYNQIVSSISKIWKEKLKTKNRKY